MMRHSVLSLILGFLLMAGCQAQHQKNKQAAMARWQAARASLHVDMARQQFEHGELPKAAKTLEGVLAKNPDYPEAHLLLGRIRLEQDRLPEAQKSLQTAVDLNGRLHQGWYYLGICRERTGQFDQALDHYRQAWDLQTGHLPYLLAMAQTLALQRNYQAGLDLITDQLPSVQRDAAVYLTAGDLLHALDRPDEAVDMYRQAHLIEPQNQAVTEALAFTLYRIGRPQEALELFQELSRTAGDRSRSLRSTYELARGDCHLQLQQYHQAQRCYEQVTGDDPMNATAWKRLAQSHLVRKKWPPAEQAARRALSLDSQDTEALLVVGYAVLEQGDISSAEATFRQVIQL
ncbi:MAG: tetratricopeptide repeat protein, partial [Sedimentisphaerales bacterium]|nr:tetratricopeptide repeat protein [Sedimentisphaerales bacterium]